MYETATCIEDVFKEMSEDLEKRINAGETFSMEHPYQPYIPLTVLSLSGSPCMHLPDDRIVYYKDETLLNTYCKA
jgi:hypothetical protein